MAAQTDIQVTAVELRGLVKRYHHQPVLDHLSLVINDGEFCLLVGDNGAGKTTLLRILAGFVRPNHGQVTICGSSVNSNPTLRRKIGYIGHQPMVYQDLTAYENLCHYARLYQIADPQARIAESLSSVRLTRQGHQPVRTLSRGMQQRLSLARALLHNPSILLFDEPYTGLDQEAAAFLDQVLEKLHQPGRIILLAAHRPQRLLQIASHVAWLSDGGIYRHIPVTSLSASPELQSYLMEVA